MLAIALASAGVIHPGAAGKDPDSNVALHVLNRVTFGPRPGDLARIQQLGVDRFIDQQLHPERIDDSEVTRRLDGFQTLHLSSSDIAQRYEIPALQERRERQRQQTAAGKPADPPSPQDAAMDPERQRANLPMIELAEQKIVRAVYSDRQLQEVLTDFWFNHFNVDARKGPARYMLTDYEREVIRPHVLGHFRDLLGATAKSPAMLFYLDNWMSADPKGPHLDRARPGMRRFGTGSGQARAGRPLPSAPANPQQARRPMGLNENYGRELLELHTLGVDGGYSQADVTEAARCFTGWTILQPQRGGEFIFNARVHDNGEKTFLGVRIPAGGGIADGEKVLEIVAHHPSTARFISHKLAQRFVADEPPVTLVDRMAATFTKTGGDLRAVMKVMLESREFFSQGSYRAKLKSPLEVVASAVRAVNGEVNYAFPLANQVSQLGQPLYRKAEPTGYSNHSKEWLNSGGLLARMNFALQLADNKVPGVKVDTAKAARSEDPVAGIALGSPEFQKR